jgi:hypothetical protein
MSLDAPPRWSPPGGLLGANAGGRPGPEIVLQAPPALPRSGRGGGSTQLLFMVPMMLVMVGFSFVYIGRSGGPMTIVFGVLFGVVLIGMLVMGLSRGGSAKKAQINDERRDYLRYLAGLRGRLQRAAFEQRAVMVWELPDPGQLVAGAGTDRRWERRQSDPAFGRVRVGRGPQRLAVTLRPPQTAPLEDLDPVASTSLRHFLQTYATVPDLPVAVSMRAFRTVRVSGERDAVLGPGPGDGGASGDVARAGRSRPGRLRRPRAHGRRCAVRSCAGRSCCARPATTPRCATTSRPGRPAPTCGRCRRCWCSSTSSASCCRAGRSSSTCS